MRVIAVLTLALTAAACGPARGPDTPPAVVAPVEVEATLVVPSPNSDVDGLLPTPFTAEQIRAEWVEVFELEQLDREHPPGAAAE